MPFASTDLNRVRRYLGVSSSYDGYIQTRLNWAGQKPDIVTEVQTDLTALDALDGQIAASAAKDGLVEADVLKWAGPNGRSSGLRRRRAELVRRVAAALDLTDVLDGSISADRIARS